MAGRSDGSVESAQRAAPRLEVWGEAKPKELILFGAIRRHDDFICNGAEPIHHALNERLAKKGLERLVLAHARGLSACLNYD